MIPARIGQVAVQFEVSILSPNIGLNTIHMALKYLFYQPLSNFS